MKMTAEQLRALGWCPETGRYLGKSMLAPVAVPPVTPRPNKYGARRTAGADGRVYDSKAEAREADRLALRRTAGEIVSAVPQVSIPCGTAENGRTVRYRADFLEIREVLPGEDGWFIGRFTDKKGADTQGSRAKRAALRDLYSINVRLLK